MSILQLCESMRVAPYPEQHVRMVSLQVLYKYIKSECVVEVRPILVLFDCEEADIAYFPIPTALKDRRQSALVKLAVQEFHTLFIIYITSGRVNSRRN